jgi:hypothetical protein
VADQANDLEPKVTFPLWVWDHKENAPYVKCECMWDLVGTVEMTDSETLSLTILDDIGRRCLVETGYHLELTRFEVINEEALPESLLMLSRMKHDLR